MGWFAGAVVGWMALALCFPRWAALIIPVDVRRDERVHPWFVGAAAFAGFLAGWVIGLSLVVPGDSVSPVRLELGCALFFALPALFLARRVWRVGRRLLVTDRPAPLHLPPILNVTLAVDIADATPAPPGPKSRPWQDHRTERSLRRTGAALVALLAGLVILFRVAQAWRGVEAVTGSSPSLAGGDQGMSSGGVFLLALLVALVILAAVRAVLDWRHRRSASGLSVATVAAMNGWTYRAYDSLDLVPAFPSSPLLRVDQKGDYVVQGRLVRGSAGQRMLWACEQEAKIRRSRDSLPYQRTRSSVLVWLPGESLPPVLVTGRDNTTVRTWFGPAIQLESNDFNQRLCALTPTGSERVAVGILHARMMELLLRSTPDGAAVLVRDDYVCVWRDGPLYGSDLSTMTALALAVADLLPTYLLRDHLTADAASLIARRLPRAAP